MREYRPSNNATRDQSSLRRHSHRRNALRNRYTIAPRLPVDKASDAIVRLTIDIDDLRFVARIRAMLPEGSRLQIEIVDACQPDRLNIAEAANSSGVFALTERQQEVVALLMQGLSNKAIGRSLSLSHFTVRNHISQVMRLLGVSSRKDVRSMLDGFPLDPAPVAAICTAST